MSDTQQSRATLSRKIVAHEIVCNPVRHVVLDRFVAYIAQLAS